MVSLARSNITHQWRMFVSAAIVLFLSGSLIFVAAGLTQATIRSLTAFERSLSIDLIIEASDRDSEINLSRFLNESESYALIDFAEPLRTRFPNTPVQVNGEENEIRIIALELSRPSSVIPMFINENAKNSLQKIGSVIVSDTLSEQDGFRLNDIIQNEDSTFAIEIIGHFKSDINKSSLIYNTGFAIMSKETYRLFTKRSQSSGSSSNKKVTLVAAKVSPEVDLISAKKTLQSNLLEKNLIVRLQDEAIRSASMEGAFENSIIQGFIIFFFFATSIPFFIIVQTLRSVILSQTDQFAIMKALGVKSSKLAFMAIEQAFWIGLIGAILSYCGMTALKYQFDRWNIDFYISPQTVWVVSATIVAGSVFAGLMSTRVISKAQPVNMLR